MTFRLVQVGKAPLSPGYTVPRGTGIPEFDRFLGSPRWQIRDQRSNKGKYVATGRSGVWWSKNAEVCS